MCFINLIRAFLPPCGPTEKLKIITPLKDTEGQEGQEVVLNCEVNQDGAKAKWLKNEETLFESGKYLMVQRDNVFSLRIRDAQKDDEATYSIILNNQRGEQANSSGSLNVRGQSPKLEHRLREMALTTFSYLFFVKFMQCLH